MIRITKHYKDKNGMLKIGVAQEFIPSLFYYSPFPLSDEIKQKFAIPEYGFSNLGQKDLIIDEFISSTDAEMMEQNSYLCSYIDDSSGQAGIFATISWFKEDDIEHLVAYEMENDVKIFPRYHYYTDLHEKIDALLRFEYILGKPFDKAKEDFQRYREEALEGVDVLAREKDLRKSEQDKLMVEVKQDYPAALFDIIENNQTRMESAPTSPGEFLAVLTSNPGPLVYSLTKEPCDYLWSTIEPFENWDYPDVFLDTLSTEDTDTQETLDLHSKMADLVQKNSNIQDVQDFLRENLVDFLVEYESCVRSITFSYARIWKLKESYLVGLYKATNKGLRNNVPYAMFREGTGWKIIFDGKSFSGLRGKGFLWIYLTLFHQPSPVYYTALHDTYDAPEASTADQIVISKEPENNYHSRGYTDFEQAAYENKTIDHMEHTDELQITYSGVLTKQYYADVPTLKKFQEELEKKELALERARSAGIVELLEEKMDDLIEFLELLEKNYGIRKVKAKPGEGAYRLISSRLKDERYLKINGRIKKNYRDALDIFSKTKEAKALYEHFKDNFRSEAGAFIYEAPEGIHWHLD